MILEFGFAETKETVIITIFKPPKAKKNVEVKDPVIALKDEKTLVIDGEEIKLYAPVVNKNLINDITSTTIKIEIILYKLEKKMWYSLDGGQHSYNCKSLQYVDNELEDKSIMGLLSQIYQSGDDDTKRAMNKSLEESSGTVLNINWADVCSRKIQPEN